MLNIPLIAVELSYDANFHLQTHDADILIQLRGQHVLWQKERLLNLALQALPDTCDKIAWLDCDIVFGRSDCSNMQLASLDQFGLIQLFKEHHNLAPEAMLNSLK